VGTPPKNKWFIASKEHHGDPFNLEGLTIHEPPQGTYQADPFVVNKWVFHEWYDYSRGRISVSTVDNLANPEVILDPGFHTSFPAVAKIGKEYFMTPETGMAGELRIYRCTEFPYKWELFAQFESGFYSDVALLPGNPHMLYTTTDGDKLRIFHSKNLKDWSLQWAGDELHSRPAGNFFEQNGKIVRPVQDCVTRYGRAIHFRGAEPHSPIFKTIEPSWYSGLTGTHTFNFDDKYLVLDGRIPL
jgi:hypothetical protein